MLGKDALAILVNLSQLMAAKLEEPIFHVRGWVKNLIAIKITILYSCMIPGTCLPSPLQDRDPYRESIYGLVLAQ